MVYPAEPDFTLRDLVRIIGRRILLISLITAVMFTIAVVLALSATRRYRATGTIQVEKQSPSGLDLGQIDGVGSATDSLSSDIELQTQARILESNALALRVIERLNLQDTADYKTVSSDKNSITPANSPAYEAHLLGIFHGYLSVKPVGGTHLVDVSYLSPDPKLAANVVNGTIQELIDESREMREKSAQVASEELSRQLADLRVRSENLQAQVAQMQQDSGLYSIGTTDAKGTQQAYSAVLEQFERAGTTLSNADENLILKKGIADAARTGNPEALSSLAGNASVSGNVTSSLSTLASLRGQQATAQAQFDQLRVKFGPGYPRVAELQANLSALDAAIKQETARIGQRAQSDYQLASHTYQDAKNNYEDLKAKADTLNNKAITYMITRQEADESRSLYEDLLRRLKEAGILEDLKSSSVTVIDPALVPPSPSAPSRKLYAAIGLFGGLFLGIAAALLMNLMSDRISGPEDLYLLGLTPLTAVATSAEAVQSGTPTYDDAVRSLRSVIIRGGTTSGPQVVMVTTASPKESVGTLASDLAKSLSHQGKKVVLVEADLRSPSSSPAGAGLSALLSGRTSANEALQPVGPNLFQISSGPAVQNPLDLIDSDQMRVLLGDLLAEFNVVVLTVPSAVPFPEASILGEMVDLIVLRAHVAVTSKTSLKRASGAIRKYFKGDVFTFLDINPTNGARFYEFRSQEARGR